MKDNTKISTDFTDFIIGWALKFMFPVSVHV